MPRVLPYLRYSSPRQATGDSFRRQIAAAYEWCRIRGLTLDETDIIHDPAMSAFRGTHRKAGAFGVFLAAVNAGAFDRGTILLIEALDRASREDAVRAEHQFTSLILAGLKIVTLLDGQEYDHEILKKQPHRLFGSLAIMIAAHQQSADKASRISALQTQKRKRAREDCRNIITEMRPAWLDVINGRFIENPDAVVTIRRIFAEAAMGYGCYSIAKRLARDGIPSLTGNKKHGEKLRSGQPNPLAGHPIGNGWNKSRVREIIQSDRPLGVLQPHTRDEDGRRKPDGETIAGYDPIVVEQAVADRARAQIAARVRSGRSVGLRGVRIGNAPDPPEQTPWRISTLLARFPPTRLQQSRWHPV
jgi:hypothetical protein